MEEMKDILKGNNMNFPHYANLLAPTEIVKSQIKKEKLEWNRNRIRNDWVPNNEETKSELKEIEEITTDTWSSFTATLRKLKVYIIISIILIVFIITIAVAIKVALICRNRKRRVIVNKIVTNPAKVNKKN